MDRFFDLIASRFANWPKVGTLLRLVRSNFRFFAPYYAVALVAMLTESWVTGYSAWLLKDVIDQLFVAKIYYYLYYFSLVIIGVYALKGGASYVSAWCMTRTGNGIIARLQSRIYDCLMTQDDEFFLRYPTGEMILRCTTMAQSARSVMDIVVTGIGRDAFTLIALVSVMFIQNWQMSLAAMITAPLAIFGVRLLLRKIDGLMRQEMASASKLVTYVQETVEGIRLVKAYGLEKRLGAELGTVIGDVEQRANRINELTASTSPLMEFLAGLAIAFVVGFGSFQIVYFGQTAGSLMSFITAMLLAYEPAKRLANMNAGLAPILLGVQMLFEILDIAPTIVDQPGASEFRDEAVELSFDNVSFSYTSGTPVLSGVSFSAPPGSVTAFVGLSGAGKSTIFSLIERFYQPESGVIAFNGRDMRQFSIASLRRHIALVTQESFLFEGTVAASIAAGKPDAGMDEIEEAARLANAHDFIIALPDGYQTIVQHGGSNLSGGQRQRIAIARALLYRAPLLLLDEATSALDAKAEVEVQDALRRLMAGRTTLVIAHRLSTIRHADQICVLDHGRIVQRGTHDQLMAEGGLYAHLHALQFKDDTFASPPLAGPADYQPALASASREG